jgi:hypothetical protein
MVPVIPTVVRIFTYSQTDYEQLASRIYHGVHGIQSPSPEMLHQAARQIRRQDKLMSLFGLIAIVSLVWVAYRACCHH